MFIIRPAAEIEPQVSIASSKRILPGPMRSSASRSMRIFSDGDDCGVGAMLLVSEGCKEVALPALPMPLDRSHDGAKNVVRFHPSVYGSGVQMPPLPRSPA